MAEISSPISNGIRVARSSVSSSAFARSIGPDPATTNLLSKNQLALSTITSELGGLSQQMQGLTQSLNSIATAISNDSALEKQRDIQKITQERILAEQSLREGKESAVEKKISNALILPVQKISAKAQFTLSKLMGFFNTLLAGWLINQGVQTLKAYADGNTKQLKSIRDNVLKNLGVIGGIYLAIRTGVFGIIGAARRITGKITNGIIGGLFVKPFKMVLDLLKKAGGGLKNAASSASGAVAETAGAAKALNMKALFPPVIAGAIDTGLDIATGEEPARATAGTAGGFATAAITSRLGAMAFGPVGGLIAGAGGYFLGKGGGKNLYDYFTDKNKDNKSQPTTTLSPEAKDLKLQSDNKKTENTDTSAFSMPPLFGKAEVNTSEDKSAQTQDQSSNVTAGDITPAKENNTPTQAVISPVPSSQTTQSNTQNLGPLPEPPPTIIAPPPPPSTPAPPTGPSGSDRAANYSPAFPTSNPENFYTLYAQVHYNVVM